MVTVAFEKSESHMTYLKPGSCEVALLVGQVPRLDLGAVIQMLVLAQERWHCLSRSSEEGRESLFWWRTVLRQIKMFINL